MVAPVIGPITTSVGQTGSSNSYSDLKEAYRQARPYTLVLPYRRHTGKVIRKVGSPPYDSKRFADRAVIDNWYPPIWNHLGNSSYDKLKSKTSSRASMSTTLAEGSQSISMIANRLGQLTKTARQIRKLDFAGASKTLNLAVTPKGVSGKKAFSGNWLEYYFGWAPLVGDIGSAIDVLQSPIDKQIVRAQASMAFPYSDLQPPQEVSRPTVLNDWVYTKFYERLYYDQLVLAQGMKVSVTNPNLWLANQMGFVNPATVAWELVPFSFVVDWFVNVEQFLSSGTDWLGLTVSDPWTVRHAKLSYHYFSMTTYKWWVNGSTTYSTTLNVLATKAQHTARNTGLTSPVLTVKPARLWGWQRCLTAASLFVQVLMPGR